MISTRQVSGNSENSSFLSLFATRTGQRGDCDEGGYSCGPIRQIISLTYCHEVFSKNDTSPFEV